MKNLKILQVCSSRAWGGMEMHVVRIASALKERGHDVTILCYPQSSLFSASQKKGVPCIAMRLDSYFRPVQMFRLVDYLKENSFDMLHCHYTKDLWSLIPAVGLVGGGNVVVSKGVGPGKRKADPFHKWIYKHVNGFIAKSGYLHRRVLEAYPVEPEKVVLLHNGVDLKRFDPELHNGDKVREEFSIGKQERIVGTVGRISPAKGHTELLQAATRVKEILPRTKFLIVGDASQDEAWYDREVRQCVKKLGLNGHAIFTGFREDIPAVLAALDLFVLPSHSEAFGNTLVEAMAMGKACIATAAGGVLDIVEDGISGLLIPPRDVEALVEAIVLLLKDTSKREQFGQTGRRRVEDTFDMNHIIARLEELYLHILREGKRVA